MAGRGSHRQLCVDRKVPLPRAHRLRAFPGDPRRGAGAQSLRRAALILPHGDDEHSQPQLVC